MAGDQRISTYKAFFESARDAIFVEDSDEHIVDVNPAACELVGYSRKQLLKMKTSELQQPEELQENIFVNNTRFEIRLRHSSGILIPAEATLAEFEEDGQQRRIMIVRDLMSRKQAEIDRDRMIEDLQAYDRMVAHDLTNPATLIMGYLDVLAEFDDVLPQEVREYIGAVRRGTSKMLSIINELLVLASLRNTENVPVVPLDMDQIVGEVLQRLNPMMEERQGRIVLPKKSWGLSLGYAPWVEQVWFNYISNAIKYGGQPPEISLGWEKSDGMIRYVVKDNGRGIPTEEQNRLFSEFTRLDATRAKGIGLGLSIVRRLVNRMGGQVGLDSVPGKGSTFSFTLPAQE
jgi:PAS domain S-box-containing protein